MKHWARLRPEQCGFDDVAAAETDPVADPRPPAGRAAASARLRRRLLVKLGVRTGKGRVETELFAEHALRSLSPQLRRPS